MRARPSRQQAQRPPKRPIEVRASGLLLLALLGCQSAQSEHAKKKSTAERPAKEKVQLLAAPAQGSIQDIVQREQARAQSEGRQLLIYVGAPWCEPCRRFHQAAEAGSLDDFFPKLRILEFDRDRDEARLEQAQCSSKLIPLFALPDKKGRCSERRFFGSIKGPGAVANITPRLRALLATASN